MHCLMRTSILIEPPVAAVHALIPSLSPVISLMGQPLLILPSVHLVIVSIRVLPIESALGVSLEVLPHLRVALSLRAGLIFRGVDVSGVGGEDWRLVDLRGCDIDSGVVGRQVVVSHAGSDSEGGLRNLFAVDEGSDEAESEYFLDVHSIVNYF